jgi:Zn-dependent peptidase ImmA (M78 family)/transcriptional regulator with XRE-family HTH domain
MAIDQVELGRRLRQAREACGLTQDEIAEHLGVSRPTVALMELGKRAINSFELDRLAYLYARDIREFLAADFTEDEVVRALFRSDSEADQEGVRQALRDCIALGHELTNLEDLLGISRGVATAAAYSIPTLRSRWEAIQAGEHVAVEERRRLGLGSAPISDLVRLLESQGIRTGVVPMPDDISGLTIAHPHVGLFVVVNSEHGHAPARQRFSWCHEYAHVLLDRSAAGRISRTGDRTDLVEVRANAFAAAFLMPTEGVRQYVATLGKGASSRIHAEIFDEDGVVPVDARTEPGSQSLQLYDVVPLAHFFGVSVLSALYRLRNLRLLSDGEFERLKEQDQGRRSDEVRAALGLSPVEGAEHAGEFSRRFMGLALDAYRRDRITKTKLQQLAGRVGISAETVQMLIESAGLDDSEPEAALAPA